jgi:hypothetical protein
MTPRKVKLAKKHNSQKGEAYKEEAQLPER